MEQSLILKNVNKTFPQFTLHNINMELPKGMIMGVVGENGAGKTTVIQCILNLLKLDDGEIEVLGRKHTDPVLKEDIGVVFDENNYFDTMNIQQINKMMQKIYKKWQADEFLEMCHTRFALPENKLIKDFSRGMHMKLAIAMALSHEAKLLILDEPTSGLDPVTRDEILDIFLDFVQDEHHSILLSSHISTDIEKIADYITYIHEGSVIFSKSKDELLENFGIMRCSKAQLSLIDEEDIIAKLEHDYSIDVLIDHKEVMKKKYKDIVMDKPTLDDIMLLYAKGERKTC